MFKFNNPTSVEQLSSRGYLFRYILHASQVVQQVLREYSCPQSAILEGVVSSKNIVSSNKYNTKILLSINIFISLKILSIYVF